MTDSSLPTLTARIVAAYVSNQNIDAAALPDLIRDVHTALSAIEHSSASAAEATLTPAVPIKRSVFADYIVCLEDGRKFKTLRRHLRTAYGMTAEQYRTRWGLPPEYPMVAPSYTERRSELARETGLGRKAILQAAEPMVADTAHTPKRRRARV